MLPQLMPAASSAMRILSKTCSTWRVTSPTPTLRRRSVGVGDVTRQVEQVFESIRMALDAAGMSWGNIVQFTSYLTDEAFIAPYAEWRAANFPKMFGDGKYPTN